MIAVYTSAVVAILEKEEDAAHYIMALEADEAPIMSAATFVELSAVMWHKRGGAGIDILDRFMTLAKISIEPLTHNQAILARDAYFRFGSLNFGDTYAYALASDRGIPLLFKGNDFTKTDIRSC